MSETPLVKKLGIKPGQRVLLLRAPQDYRALLGALPEGVVLAEAADGAFDVVQLFAHTLADLEEHAPGAIAALRPGGLLWISYPKKSSKVSMDLNRDIGWEPLAHAGLRPVTQIAIDGVWSALRFRPVAEVKSTSQRTWGAHG
jgi:hypothetical protein